MNIEEKITTGSFCRGLTSEQAMNAKKEFFSELYQKNPEMLKRYQNRFLNAGYHSVNRIVYKQ